MKTIVLGTKKIITGEGSFDTMKDFSYKKIFLVTGGNSMRKYGWIDRAIKLINESGGECFVHEGIGMNPTREEVLNGLAKMRQFKPDCILAIGGGSALDAAKAMLLFFEFPELNFDNVLKKNIAGEIPVNRKTALICIPSTSGTGSEVTKGTVITDTLKKLKVPIMTDCLRPDFAILDPALTMTMPLSVAAETGMDALTHALEAYINHNLDDFDEALCRASIEGIIKWLPESFEKGTKIAREKVHNYQSMAGIGFANVGLGMVHGIAHSFGAVFNLPHGLTNAIILPFALKFNSQNAIVKEKLDCLSYHCHCKDIVEEIDLLRARVKIPKSYKEAGILEEDFIKQFDLIVEHAMLGATRVNPVRIRLEDMRELVKQVYYGI